MAICHKCRGALPERPRETVSRSASCPSCSAYVRCCLNCRFLDPGSGCREPQAEWVSKLDAANFCDFFQLNQSEPAQTANEGEPATDPFDALFKK